MSIDYLLRGGTVIDGSSVDAVPKRMDVAIEGDHIKKMGDLSHSSADEIIDVEGMIVSPGFIDVHSHSEFTLLADGRAEGKICQGITTEINGNCGLSAAPLLGPAMEQRETELEELDIRERWETFEQYFALLEEKNFAVNFVTLAGHGNIRASVMGYADRQPSGSEKKHMTSLLRAALDAGARGLSTGLIYPPGIYSDTAEIAELTGEVTRFGGVYTTHMRSEGDALLESVREVVHIARETGVRAHISHLKTSGRKNWEKIEALVALIRETRESGAAVTCDRYPYTASSTDLDTLLPSWTFEGGRKKEIERLKREQEKIFEEMIKEHPETAELSFWKDISVSSVGLDKNKWMEGKSMHEICDSLHRTPFTVLFELLIEESLNVGAVFSLMNEDNLKMILKEPYSVIGTDSAARCFDGITAGGVPHPRGFGSFPRVLGRYTKALGLLSLSEAVYKMAGLPARIFNIRQRGVLREGFFADITVFDMNTIHDTADYQSPFQRPRGINHVFVNGRPVLLQGAPTGLLPGKIIR